MVINNKAPKKVYFQADLNRESGGYEVTEYIPILPSELEKSLMIYEALDVHNAEYQLWEYPSGNLYQVIDSLDTDDTGETSPQRYWGLRKVGSEPEKVWQAYSTLYSEEE